MIRIGCISLMAVCLAGCNPTPSTTNKAPSEPSAAPATKKPEPAAKRPASNDVLDLDGNVIDPFAGSPTARVFVFITTDCPIANRYAPKLQRMTQEFSDEGVELFLVYPNAADTPHKIRKHLQDYAHTATALIDANHALVRKTQATVTPEAAVFDSKDQLAYCGRIDDWYVDFGKNRKEPTTHELRDAVTAVVEGGSIETARVKAVGCYIPELDK